jgi:murein DD-endopeptidase MepM/ murein hydrolase activator NlpD
MDAPRNAPHARTRLVLRAGALLLTIAASLALAGPAGAATAVATATASPPAFVPDWDGHSDATVLTYRLEVRSTVVIRVVDHRGRVVTSMRVGVRDAGTHHATWDGRDARGRVQPPGTYGLRVDARPVAPPSGEPGTAAMGGTVAVAGARAATVTLQRADVVLTGVELTRTAVGARGAAQRTGARFQLSAPATVSAAIVDSAGRVVRTLSTSRMRAGRNALAWDGRHGTGQPAADGEYSLVVAATSGGRPTDTMRVPLSVDRATPKSNATKRSTARIDGRGRLFVPIVVTTNERATVVVRAGRRQQRIPVEPGTHRLSVDATRLGLRPTGRARSVTFLVQVVDGAGNATSARTTVSIPKRPARTSRPVTPAPKPNPPANPGNPAPVLGKWPWPIGGVVTSEFGLRDGRPHTGIDIGAPKGTPIHPTAPGTVSFVGQLGGYGNLVIVEHPNGVRTYYAHMSRFGTFAVGAAVTHLDVIGEVGCTGNCTGNHLHFETRTADTPRNPRSYLTAR